MPAVARPPLQFRLTRFNEEVSLSFTLSFPSTQLWREKVVTNTPASNLDEPDRALYERAMRDLNKNKFTVGRLALQTLINTYPDSEYLSQAKYAMAESFLRKTHPPR